MAEESEKRFQRVMDKLFHAPKSKPPAPLPSSPSPRVKKHIKSAALPKTDQNRRLNLLEENGFRRSEIPLGSQAPVCRPWDRGDLMRRLSTFKSMTWFAKPKVVNPVNCARRGWVNVEMDTISCEACGARLLFSTPSSWTQQQVEKAAAVFSLKLDSGHKLLCPWVDNACNETLALFPPTPAPALVEGYKARSSSLLQLSALPVISSAAIEYIWGPKLQWLLEQYSRPICFLHGAVVPVDSSEDKGLDGEAVEADLYYQLKDLQAQKLISLCGWEPRLLPYIVDCEEDKAEQPSKETNEKGSSSGTVVHSSVVIVYPSSGNYEVSDAKDADLAPHTQQPVPASVVLDCQFCGASVGLWAFTTVHQPLELIRLVVSAETSNQADFSSNGDEIVKRQSNGSLNEMPSCLNVTIAGGPPPTKQNLRATVSLPIINKYLRTAPFSVSSIGTLKRKRTEDESKEDGGIKQSEMSHMQRKELSSSSDYLKEKSNINNKSEDLGKSGEFLENVETALVDSGLDASSISQLRDYPADACRTARESGIDGKNSSEPAEADVSNMGVAFTDTIPESTGTLVDSPSSYLCDSVLREEDGVYGNDMDSVQLQDQATVTVGKMIETSVNNQVIAVHSPGKNVKLIRGDKKMHFDPIKQHRHFCPWIASADNSHLPGWQATLSALFQEESPHTSLKEHQLDSSTIELDDPITSVRELFMSPAEKKRKSIHLSS